jgi:hypothetical protein
MEPTDDDVRVLLRSPALTLEPPTALPAAVRRQARRHRVRTRATGAGVAAAVVAGALLLGPGLKGSFDELRGGDGQTADVKADPRAPAATTEVVTLQQINGAEILTWFEGSQWCTVTTRQTHRESCQGPVNPAHEGFSWILASGSPSLTVDREHVVAGLVPPGASRVGVHMKDGREYSAVVSDGAQFPQPVWSVRVDDSAYPVDYYVAYDSAGQEIARKPA